jgi:hypothetical protein
MIVAGMMSGIFVVSLKIMKNQNKMGKSSSEEFEIIYLFDDIRNQLSNRKICLKTFSKIDFETPSELGGIASIKENQKYSVQTFSSSGLFYGQNNIKVNSIRYEVGDQESSLKDGEAFLIIDFNKSKSALGSTVVTKKMKIHLEFDSKQKLHSCFALAGVNFKSSGDESQENKWKNISGSQDIYTDVEQVRINTNQGSKGASLVLAGKLLLGHDENKCTTEKLGTLRLENLQLELCNKASRWKPLWWPLRQTIIKEYKLATKKENHIIETSEPFSYCSLSKVELFGARCNIKRMDGNLWKLSLLYDRGNNSECLIKCFK